MRKHTKAGLLFPVYSPVKLLQNGASVQFWHCGLRATHTARPCSTMR